VLIKRKKINFRKVLEQKTVIPRGKESNEGELNSRESIKCRENQFSNAIENFPRVIKTSN
jgi:hypothetical protein